MLLSARQVPLVGGMELSGFSAHLRTPVLIQRQKYSSCSEHPPLRQTHWAGYLPGEVSAGEVATGPLQRPHAAPGLLENSGAAR